ncbi:MAG: SDR family NAD(P)-dependent oxidoreductase, partial [Nevskiales bacterium]
SNMNLNGKTIVITGASSGIGEAAAKKLAALGAKIVLVARREDELQRVASEIEATGGEAVYVAADLSNEDSVKTCGETILAQHAPVDILINNAGRSIRRSIRDSVDRYHDYQRTIQLNYLAAVQLSLLLLPSMMERENGHIINISSMSSLIPMPRYSAYVGSKSALDAFSRSLSAEMVNHGIAATSIHYPLVYTEMSKHTDIYKNFKMMDVDTAADWIVKAIDKRPQRVANGIGQVWGAATTLIPTGTTKFTGRLMNYAAKRLKKKAAAD